MSSSTTAGLISLAPSSGIQFVDIGIYHDELGKPHIEVTGKAKELIDSLSVSKIHVSLSHLKEIATAVVILECETANTNA